MCVCFLLYKCNYDYIYICWCSRWHRPLYTNHAIAKLRHHTCKLRPPRYYTPQNYYIDRECLILYLVLHRTSYCSKVVFLLVVNVICHTCIHKTKHQQSKLQRVIPIICNWSIREKATRINCSHYWQPPPSFPHTLTGTDAAWSCCSWPLHPNLLYTLIAWPTLNETQLQLTSLLRYFIVLCIQSTPWELFISV